MTKEFLFPLDGAYSSQTPCISWNLQSTKLLIKLVCVRLSGRVNQQHTYGVSKRMIFNKASVGRSQEYFIGILVHVYFDTRLCSSKHNTKEHQNIWVIKRATLGKFQK